MSEWAGLNLADKTDEVIRRFVTDLYRIFLRRAPDPIGLESHSQQLKSGVPLSDYISIFCTSEEHEALVRREIQASSNLSEYRSKLFPEDYLPPGEAGKGYLRRIHSGFFQRYCSGSVVIDVGYSGYDNPEGKAAFPHAIGIDLDYPGYDGIRLPFDDGSVDTVFSSHCLEHILFDHAAIRDWHRVLRVGGFIVCMVPSQALYEKKRFLPSRFNADHKRLYTPSNLALSFETALETNSYRLRHLAENDRGFNYALGPEAHSTGAYEIEIVIEKIKPPSWGIEA